MNSVEALLFDLGGVVLDIDFDRVFSYWAKHSNRSFEEIQSGFSFDPFYEAHEIGKIDTGEYFNSLRKTLGMEISDADLLDGWNDIHIGEIDGIMRLLKRAGEKLPVYAFTNSNQAHQKTYLRKFPEVLSLFQTVFDSSDIGKRKPAPESFQHVADAIQVNLSRIVFYDDSLENIIGAKNVGLKTVHVRSIEDIENSFNVIFG